jgi:hypothetical protein
MRARAVFVVSVAGGVLGLSLAATATPPTRVNQARVAHPGPGSGGTDSFPFTENFDSYANGSGVSTNGAWSVWAPGSPDGVIDNAVSFSSPNSMKTQLNSDNVQQGMLTSGRWRLRVQTYMPTANGGGTGFVIGLNTFAQPAGPYSWSMDIQWVPGTGQVSCYDFAGAPTTPIVYDQWVELKVEIDLGTDTYNCWYGANQIVTNRSWSQGYSPTGGLVQIQCFDFYSQGQSDLRYDNISFQAIGGGCYANCDGSTSVPFLNIADFVCFQSAFAAGSSYANCDQSSNPPVLNIADFVCFQSQFAAGCSAP